MFAAVFLGLAITTGTKLDKTTAAERIEGEIDSYRDRLKQKFASELFSLPSTMTNKNSDRQAQDHNLHSLCRHDEAVVAAYFRGLQQLRILPFECTDHPLLTHSLRLIALADWLARDHTTKMETGSNSGYGSYRQATPASCTACSFKDRLNDSLFSILMTSIGSRQGKCLLCLLRANVEHDCRDKIDGKSSKNYSQSFRLLFGDSPGDCLLRLNGRNSVEETLFRALKLAYGVQDSVMP
ncbi:hypothetical protein LTR37_016652 [Vermiconidia calcicola]|uniref:Uncharacterized protein n=1 Tax=Vermiconidia calcicola TaxID=1690605 RepID=A0ACC3MNU7_9PEZI|nr:hypothetical protein LTR37_016652 [Vermiconidia calcicola]